MALESDAQPHHAKFRQELAQLQKHLLKMASTAQENLERAVTGLLNGRENDCRTAIADDELVNQYERSVDAEGIRILSLYNPAAAHLRRVVASMKIATDLERVSDEAGNIARRARKILQNTPDLRKIRFIEPAYQLASSLLRESVRAFAEGGRGDFSGIVKLWKTAGLSLD